MLSGGKGLSVPLTLKHLKRTQRPGPQGLRVERAESPGQSECSGCLSVRWTLQLASLWGPARALFRRQAQVTGLRSGGGGIPTQAVGL